jgi:DNA-binding response OmpR family regulator
MKLLIVEDEPNLLAILRKDSQSRTTISVSLDGKTALEMISNYIFDVVVLDVMLPDVNGIEICRRVRADKNLVLFYF